MLREQGKAAEITSHYFGGAVSHSKAAIDGGQLKLSVPAHRSATEPLEWMEVRIPG